MTNHHKEILKRVGITAIHSSAVFGATTDAQAMLGFLAGSLYGLRKACELEYQDRSGLALPAAYPQELQELLRELGSGSFPSSRQWLAGFYLNSALQRLAALYHRCLKILLKKEKGGAPALAREAVDSGLLRIDEIAALATVHKEVNKLKHDTYGILKGRTVDLDLGATATEQALILLKLSVYGSSKDNV